MIKENQKLLNRLQVVLDGMTIVASYMLAWYIRFQTGIFEQDPWTLSMEKFMQLLLLIVPGFLILYYAFRLYEPKRVLGRRLEAWRMIQANVLGVMILILLLYLIRQFDISRNMLFVFACTDIFMGVLERNIVRYILRRIRKNGHNLKHIILVGYSRAAEQYIDRIMVNPEWGYYVRGILDDTMPHGMEYRGIKVLGSIDNLNIILPQNRLDEIVITLGLSEYHKLERIVGMCEKSGVHTKFIPDYNNIIPTRPYTEDIQGIPVINIRHVPLNNTLNWISKRVMDIFGSLFAIVLFSPVMLIVALTIKITDPGPLIFKQERIGLKNKPFYMYKFRSMVMQSESDEEKGWTRKDDPWWGQGRNGRSSWRSSRKRFPDI